MDFKIKPWFHQMQAIERSTVEDFIALFYDIGTGKTSTTINMIRVQMNLESRFMRTIIFCPVATLYNWKREFMMHSSIKPEKITVLDCTGAKRVKKFHDLTYNKVTGEYDQPHIIITNYDSIRNEELLKMYIKWSPQILVADESQLIKEPTSLRSKAVYEISKSPTKKYILSGEPILNSPMDLFMQYKILDGGTTFGTNFWVFRSTYFYDAAPQRSFGGRHIPEWTFKKDKIKEFQEKVFSRALVVDKSECLDLPPLIKKVVYVELSPKQAKMYKELKRDYFSYIESSTGNATISATIALTKLQKMMQICYGFVIDDDRITHEFEEDIPRLIAVEDILRQISEKHKCILWCCYKYNYKQLAKVCDKLGLEYVFITGEQNAKEKQESIDTFENDVATRIVIANRRAGGTGINLIAASYSIVYSRNFSLDEELQSEGRNYRGGSDRHESIVKIDLCTKGTVDETTLEALKKKEQISNAILDERKI